MKTDSLFYHLFQDIPRLLFDFIEQSPDRAEQYRFTSVELKEMSFRVDGVFLPPEASVDWPIFFVEVQFQSDPALYRRLFAEIFLYLRQQAPPHPWQAVVVYPTRAVDPGEHPHYNLLLRSPQVTRVYLDEWVQSRQTWMQQLIGVLLAPPQQAVSEARTVLTLIGEGDVVDKGLAAIIVNLIETILVYKLPTLSREEIQAMLELTEVDLKQTRFYQDVFTEGRQEEGTALILDILQHRCGELAPALAKRVAQLSLPQLRVLGRALLEFRGTADLEQWLAAYAKESSGG